MISSNKQFFTLTSLFIGTLALFSCGIASQEVIGFDSRFYLFALEMMQNGASWFGTTYQQPYPDYPASSTFIIWILAHFFGGMNKFIAVLPSNILAALTMTITYQLGALHHKRWGWYAVFFLLSTVTFFKSARAISLDLYPTLITTLCFYLLYAADFHHKQAPYKTIYLLLFCGFLFRGPIGLVMPTGIVCAYLFLTKEYKQFFMVGLNAFLLLVLCSGILLFLAYRTGGYNFMQEVLSMQAMRRMTDSSLPYFYFTQSFFDYAFSFPVAAAFLLSLACTFFSKKTLPRAHRKIILQLIGWMLVILLGMSIPGEKKIRYLLPFTPAIALLAAYPFAFYYQNNFFIVIRWFFLRLFLFLPLLFFFCLTIVLKFYSLHFSYNSVGILLICLQAANTCIYFFSRTENVRTSFILFSAAISFILMMIKVVEPIQLDLDKTHDFVVQVEMQRKAKNARLVFYKEPADGLAIKYLINMEQREQPLFLTEQKTLVHYEQPAFFITKKNSFVELDESKKLYQVIKNGKIGHVPVVVFTRKKV